uniref:Uncharacterized protein n=1 Tax=viral metagenome TaxID=1070528 RepID=A0A6C0C8I2_9ZZZZ
MPTASLYSPKVRLPVQPPEGRDCSGSLRCGELERDANLFKKGEKRN